MILPALLACLALAAGGPTPATAPPPVGFIWHYPYVMGGDEKVPASGATVMASRAPWGTLQPGPGRFDFSTLDRELVLARQGGYRLALILECNPFCAPKWVVDEVAAAGQLCRDAAGSSTGQAPFGGMPRASSPVFVARQTAFLKALVEHLRTTDAQHTVVAYYPGIEWWFPPTTRYGPDEVAGFRQWLRRRYGQVGRLNHQWGTNYAGFSDVQPPEIDPSDLFRKGRTGLGGVVPTGSGRNATSPGSVSDWGRYWALAAGGTVNGLARRVKRLDRTRKTISFLSFSFARTAEWDYTEWCGTELEQVARRSPDIDILGMQLVASDGDTHRITAGLDLARKHGKPMWDLDLLDFARGVAIGPDAMRQATLEAVQHGARGLVYCCWTGAKDFNFYPDWPMDTVRAMVDEGRQALEATEGYRPAVEAALVLPYIPRPAGKLQPAANDPLSFMGLYKLLGAMHIALDVVSYGDLEANPRMLDRYRWVALPDAAWISGGALSALQRFGSRKGYLLAAGRLPEVFDSGVPVGAGLRADANVRDLGARYAGALVRDNSAGDTPPMFIWGPDTPERAAVREQAHRAIGRFLREEGIRPQVEVDDGGEGVTCMPMRGSRGDLLFMVRAAGREPKPATLRWRTRATAAMVARCDGVAHRVDVVRDVDGVTVVVPPFARYCVLTQLPGEK